MAGPTRPTEGEARGPWARLRRGVGVAMDAERRFLQWRPASPVARSAVRVPQVLALGARLYRRGAHGDIAGSLAFTSLLSLLPLLLFALLALGFAGASPENLERVRRFLLGNFVPDTAHGIEATIESSLESLHDTGARLGLLGLVLLGLTGWKLLGSLGRAFDRLGGGETATPLRRAAGLWGTVFIAPFLVTASLALTGYLQALAAASDDATRAVVGRPLAMAAAFAPAWSALLVAYSWCPARRPAFRAAAAGALVGAVAWEVLKAGFAEYIRRAFLTRTVLAGMGVFPVFLLWLYLSWVVFVIGADVVPAAEDYEAALERAGCPRENGGSAA